MQLNDQQGQVLISFLPKGLEAPLTFKDIDALVTWAQKQRQFFANLPKTILDSPIDIANTMADSFGAIAANAQGLSNMNPQQRQHHTKIVTQMVTWIENGALPITESPRGKEIAALYGTNPLAGAALLALTFEEHSGSAQARWPGIIAAKAVLEVFSGNNYTATANAQEAVFKELRLDLTEKANDLLKEMQLFSEGVYNTYEEKKAALEKLIKESEERRIKLEEEESTRTETFNGEKAAREKEWKALVASYATHMQLSASVSYWNAKRKTHTIEAKKAAKWFGIGAVISAIIVICAAYVLLAAVDNASTIMQIRATIFVGFPAFLAIWALRFVSRRLIINQALADDATERVAMVHAFKALEKEGKADPSERLLVLQALFRPATAPTDDTAPIAIVGQLLKEAKRD